ncbi:MAG: hypothetical protein ACYDEO_12285 [Aggregatilineales bacterium]
MSISRPYCAGRLTRRVSPFAIRAIVLWAVLIQLSPAPPRPIVEPQQTVQTAHPIVCVHTRLTDEVEDWKIQKTLQLVREMGAATIVDFFPWAYVETAPGVYDWHHPDRIIAYAREQGISVIARLGLVPAWARPKASDQQTSLNSLTPDHYADYAQFVGAFAARYQGQVTAIIAWNEPNLSFEWGYRYVTLAEYVDFLKGVYVAAHAANPDIVVLGGALAPTLEKSDNALDDLDFLQGVYDAGGAPYFDGLAVHTYGFTQPPDALPDPNMLNFRRLELLRAIMMTHGDAYKPVYITESGWNDAPRWTLAVTPGQRVAYTLDAYRLAEVQWPWVKQLCMWYFRAPAWTHAYPDYWSFVTPDFQLRPIYAAVQAYARAK